MEASTCENNWKERGFSFKIGKITLEKGVDEARHEDLDELVLALNGKLEFTIDDKIFVAEENKEVLIPAKAIHSIKNVGADTSTIYFGYKKVAL